MSKASAQEALRGLPKIKARGGGRSSTPVISTGSLVLNFLIGGDKLPNGQPRCPGIPRGRITELYGEEGTGKTTIALGTAVQCQREGGTVCYLDYENSFPTQYAEDIGVSLSEDAFSLHSPATWEEGADLIEAAVVAGVDLIVVDSLAMIRPGSSEHTLQQLVSDFLPKIVDPLRRSDTALVCINALRRLPNADRLSYHGLALKYYASLRIKLKSLDTEYDGTHKARYKVIEAEGIKNMVSSHQGHYTSFIIRYGEGIDNVRSVIDIAQAKGLLVEEDDAFRLDGLDRSFESKEGLRDFFMENPDQFEGLVEKMTTTSTENT